MNTTRLACLIVCLWAANVSVPVLARAAESPAAEDLGTQIQQLQEERIKTLQRVVEYVRVMYSQGMLDFTTVVESQLELLDAQLEDADTNEERIRILESQAKSAAELVEITEVRFQAGVVSELDVLRAKALQLRVKIKLLQIRQKMRDKKTP